MSFRCKKNFVGPDAFSEKIPQGALLLAERIFELLFLSALILSYDAFEQSELLSLILFTTNCCNNHELKRTWLHAGSISMNWIMVIVNGKRFMFRIASLSLFYWKHCSGVDH